MWFREYTFNLIIQPFHLLLYTVMVGSAMSLAAVSLPYAVVAIYFLIPGEKLLRKFFGFDNAGTLSAAGSFAGGALFSAMINKMNRPKPGHEKEKDDKPKIRKPSGGTRVGDDALQVETNGVAGSSGGGSGGSPGGVPGRSPGGVPGGSPGGGSGGGSGSLDFMLPRGYKDNALVRRDKDGNIIGGGSKWALAKEGLRNRLMSSVAYNSQRTKNAIKRSIKAAPKTAGRMVRRGAIGALAGGTAGLLALGASAATGDPSKAIGLMAAAGAAGYNFGNYYGDKFAKGVGSYADGARTAFWGTDMKSINQYNFDQEFISNPETISKLTQALGSTEKAREAIKDGSVQALLNENITDPGKLAKALALKNRYMTGKGADGRKYSPEEAMGKAILMAKWNRDANPGIFNTMSREQTSFRRNLEAQGIKSEDIDRILADLEYFEI